MLQSGVVGWSKDRPDRGGDLKISNPSISNHGTTTTMYVQGILSSCEPRFFLFCFTWQRPLTWEAWISNPFSPFWTADFNLKMRSSFFAILCQNEGVIDVFCYFKIWEKLEQRNFEQGKSFYHCIEWKSTTNAQSP